MTSLAGSYVPEIEQEALGALLHGGDYRKVAPFLRYEHFIADVHIVLFKAIGEAFHQYGSTTPPVVARLLPADSDQLFMIKAGETAMSYMTGLREATTYGSAGLERSGRAVVAQWARLKAGEVGSRLTAAAADPGADASALMKGVAEELDTIAAELRAGPRRNTLFTIDQATDQAVADIREAMARGNGLTGTTWGLSDINSATGGIQRGEMAVIGARPSMGKTAVALSVALRAAGAGTGVAFLSLEMGAAKLSTRALSDIAYDWNVKVPYADMIRGKTSEKDLEAVQAAAQDLGRLPLWIEEQPGLTITDVRVKVERIAERAEARNTPLGLLIIDYMQLVRPSSRYAGNRTYEIAETSAALREMGREFNLGVVALSQLSRGVESRDDKRPMLSDLRESGSIEQDADLVAFLYREAYYLEKAKGKDAEKEADRVGRLIDVQNELEFIIAKQRNGPVKTVKLFIDIACSAVRNAARQ